MHQATLFCLLHAFDYALFPGLNSFSNDPHLADTFAGRELDRWLAEGQRIASIELPVEDDGLDIPS